MRRRALLGTLASMVVAGCGGNSASGRRAGGGSPLDGRVGIDGGADAPQQVGIDGNTSVGGGLDVGIEGEDIGVDENISIGDEEIGIGGEIGIGPGSDVTDMSGRMDVATPPIEEQFAGNQKATALLFNAHDQLTAAYEAYVENAPDDQLLGVEPTIKSFTRRGVRRHIQHGRVHARQALEYTTDNQAEAVGGLNQAIVFLLGASHADKKLIDAYNQFDKAKQKLYNETDFSGDQYGLHPVIDELERLTAQAAEKRQTVTEATDVAAAVSLVPLSPRDYQLKLTIQQQVITSFDNAVSGYNSLSTGISNLRRGVYQYDTREYSQAASHFTEASIEFRAATRQFQPGDVSSSVADALGDRHAMAQSLDTLATRLEESTAARMEEDLEKYTQKREAAIAVLDSRDDIQRIPELGLIRF